MYLTPSKTHLYCSFEVNSYNLNWIETFNTLSEIKSLKRIGIPFCNLSKMPEEFEKLMQVKTFWLNGNSFDNQEQQRLKRLLPNAELEFN